MRVKRKVNNTVMSPQPRNSLLVKSALKKSINVNTTIKLGAKTADSGVISKSSNKGQKVTPRVRESVD